MDETKPKKRVVKKKVKVEKDASMKGIGKQLRKPKVEARKIESETHAEELAMSDKVKKSRSRAKATPKKEPELMKEPELIYDAKKEPKVIVEMGEAAAPKKSRKPRVKKERTDAQKEADKAKMAKLREMRKKKE